MGTLVGETTLVRGHLEGDEDLTVLGRLEGSVSLTKTLTIEPSGIVKAEVSVRNCVVSGVVVGNITASDSVELTEAARVVGDITAPRVIIIEGASFRGRVDMGSTVGERPAMARPVPVARPAMATASRPAPTPARPAMPSAPAARPAPMPARPAAPAARPAAPAARPAATTTTRKAPAAPPPPPPSSGGKKKVKVRKR